MFILLIIFTYLLTCPGCVQEAYSIQLKQAESEIIRITFVNNERNTPQTVYVTETDTQIMEIASYLQVLEIGRFHNDPPTSYGKLYVEICYQNGDIEILGTDMLKYISIDGTIEDSYGGWYYVKMEAMLELFQRYIS